MNIVVSIWSSTTTSRKKEGTTVCSLVTLTKRFLVNFDVENDTAVVTVVYTVAVDGNTVLVVTTVAGISVVKEVEGIFGTIKKGKLILNKVVFIVIGFEKTIQLNTLFSNLEEVRFKKALIQVKSTATKNVREPTEVNSRNSVAVRISKPIVVENIEGNFPVTSRSLGTFSIEPVEEKAQAFLVDF